MLGHRPVTESDAKVRVFSQSATPRIDPSALRRQAQAYFRFGVDITAEHSDGSVEIRIEDEQASTFTIRPRPRNDGDLTAARIAEKRGQAAGMSLLAERCPTIWEIETDPDAAQPAHLLKLCGLLASVALGPVLPADESTLYGVRGAMERVERLLKN